MSATDTELLDWLEKQTTGYGGGWICRDSKNGKGIRLHETSRTDPRVATTAREAIRNAMEKGIR